MKERLRVAILSNKNALYEWQRLILQEIENSGYADLELVIYIPCNSKIPLSWKIFSRLEYFLFKSKPYALAHTNNIPSFNNTMECSDTKRIDLENLADYQLDLLINFADTEPQKNILSAFKYGLWNLVHSDYKNKKKGPPGIWELIQEMPEIKASLEQYIDGADDPKILAQTSVCTDWIGYSRNSNLIYWQACPLISRNLKRLYDYGPEHFNNRVFESSDTALRYSLLPYEYPGVGLLVWHSIKTVFKKIAQLIENQLFLDQWILLFNSKLKNSPYELSQYTRILPPRDRFWADPFLMKRNGKYYLFIEELIYKNKLGHLSVMELDENGNYTVPKTILEKEYHLSYPFLFEDGGELYMIPETGGNKDIQLYKCIDFPYKWQLEKVLMQDVVAVDTTIYKKDDTYWMFTNLKECRGMSSNVELFLFSSNELVSDKWTPHPLNPIVSDVKKARPAGKIFMEGEHLVRPSQNCSHHYGYGMSINKIINLDSSSYEEEVLHSIPPNWQKDVLCTHTFNSCDKIHISDAKIKRRRFF